MQVIAPERAKSVTDIRNITEKWDSRVLMLQRDFDEKVNSKMKAAILISIPTNGPTGLAHPAGRQVRGVPAHREEGDCDRGGQDGDEVPTRNGR